MLYFSYIDTTQPTTVPPRSVNGGLYTGEPFRENAPWGNVPVVPEADTYTQNLQSANPPPGAMVIPSYTRPGNNTVNQAYHQQFGAPLNFMCMKS